MDASQFPDSQQWGMPAGGWRLACGHALGLRPRRAGILEVVHGAVWLTVTGPAAQGGDLFLRRGDTFRIAAGQHAVLEPWMASGRTDGVSFLWTQECTQSVPVAVACRSVARALGDMARSHAALGGAVAALGRALWSAATGPRGGHGVPLSALRLAKWRH
ncbi:DUF2917 domain-containing protein [Paracidovorax citrulli]|uniref:DUF2917 domain-containing protein n=2 Tax=Paracidovorax citrulli TaxID=80869 RepID=A1TUE6_PARC0|nr:DUF2917 domain-containing protein [Paracidovorax citrulli]ABM34584.1 hypothetical protein Aave_4043 [Paracidovorax citrulli AAC00-1]ATG94033.1 DUF2917 domain-containing protein [Paracidovorax citrulli]MVT28085.1 DUF2917 domain-containing protein [Paracidovorax citrulli]MVT37295.1 DUF2917 domain-containing protein [Paracidovorax citrulli]PVY64023.1 hypothetical protein C8E08_1334 [Paracidovorax citrulli]